MLLKKAAGIAKGSGVPNKEKVGTVNARQIEKIVKMKMADFNARDVGTRRADGRGNGAKHGNYGRGVTCFHAEEPEQKLNAQRRQSGRG